MTFLFQQQNLLLDELDLHYLRVEEAIECLDLFLDKNIVELQDSLKFSKYVQVITGRGLNSVDGRPKIKEEVQRRCVERFL